MEDFMAMREEPKNSLMKFPPFPLRSFGHIQIGWAISLGQKRKETRGLKRFSGCA